MSRLFKLSRILISSHSGIFLNENLNNITFSVVKCDKLIVTGALGCHDRDHFIMTMARGSSVSN